MARARAKAAEPEPEGDPNERRAIALGVESARLSLARGVGHTALEGTLGGHWRVLVAGKPELRPWRRAFLDAGMEYADRVRKAQR